MAPVACPALTDEAGCPAGVVVGTAVLVIHHHRRDADELFAKVPEVVGPSEYFSMTINCILISSKGI
eukprot:3088120-Pyramimonas_sp.AAC.1